VSVDADYKLIRSYKVKIRVDTMSVDEDYKLIHSYKVKISCIYRHRLQVNPLL
jgi:hypothetical protein